jgi:hypothetical protein
MATSEILKFAEFVLGNWLAMDKSRELASHLGNLNNLINLKI